jgi:hypothetical protein
MNKYYRKAQPHTVIVTTGKVTSPGLPRFRFHYTPERINEPKRNHQAREIKIPGFSYFRKEIFKGDEYG